MTERVIVGSSRSSSPAGNLSIRYPSSSSGTLFGGCHFGFFSSSLEDVHLKQESQHL